MSAWRKVGLLSEESRAALWGRDGHVQEGFSSMPARKEQERAQQRGVFVHIYAPFP